MSIAAIHPAQFVELVKVWTGLKNPPPWVVCALSGTPYRPSIRVAAQ